MSVLEGGEEAVVEAAFVAVERNLLILKSLRIVQCSFVDALEADLLVSASAVVGSWTMLRMGYG
jgi:hypothetical protein